MSDIHPDSPGAAIPVWGSLPPTPVQGTNPFRDPRTGMGYGVPVVPAATPGSEDRDASVTQAGSSPYAGIKTPSRRSTKDKVPSIAESERPSVVSLRNDEGSQQDEKASIREAQNVEEENKNSAQPEPAPELKHVPIDLAPEIGDETESGWAAVARSIRDIDEQKIKDYKEDIDTILVFAGLYSAVLSALLAESFQALQPDPSSIMITLLGQLVTQTHTYTFNNGFLNSTIPAINVAAIPLAFKPSLAAKRVNVLWFASLTLSLMSASFGILVKQWLREYLTGEYISPQAQLRIRHFRTPGLKHWRVFAIAAMLPLVLQLALALFFIGLCFFTLDIHHSIGYTTVPLVAGWALLFVAASFSPALSPRCPYKIPIFKSVMTLLRAGLFRAIRLFKGMPPLPSKSEWIIKPNWTWWSLGYNEQDALKDPRKDVDILVDVDASQTDDQLVMKMCSALKEMHTRPELMIDFVLRLIAFRLQTEFTERPLPLMLDLSQLPVQTCTILMDTVADVLAREVRKFPVSEPIEWTDLTRDCLSLLVARLPCLLSDKAMTVVSLCFAGTQSQRSERTFELMFTSVRSEERHALCLHLQERLRNAFLHLNAWQFLDTIYIMTKKSCCTCSECTTIETVMKKHVDTIPSVLKEHTCDVLTGYMLHQVKIGAAWSEWHREIALILFKQWAGALKVPWHGALKELVRHLLTKPKFAPYFYRHLFHKNEFESAAETIFDDTFPSSTEKQQILINLYNVFTTYLVEMTKMPVLLDDSFYLNLLWFVDGQMSPMTFAVNNNDRSITELRYLPVWQMIWKMMHNALRRFDPSTRTEKQTTWASTCLEKIDTLDDLWLPPNQTQVDASEDFDGWVKAFNPAKSFFDDDVIEDLMKFIPAPEDAQYKRVRRIYRKRELARLSQAEKELIQETTEEKIDNSEVGLGDAAGNANAAAADEAEHADDPPVSPVSPISQPSLYGDMNAAAAHVVNAETNNPAVAFTLTPRTDVVPEPGQLIQIRHPVPLVRGDTDRTLVLGTGPHAGDFGGTTMYLAP